MSETTAETATETEQNPTEPAETTEPLQLPDDHPLVKTLAAQKAEIKDLKAGRIDANELKRLRELDDATKTEAQKSAEALDRLTKENESLRLASLRANTAADRKVPLALLTGSTQDELNAQADLFLAELGKASTAAAPADKQGLDGESASRPAQLTRAQLASMKPEDVQKARKEGRADDALGITR